MMIRVHAEESCDPSFRHPKQFVDETLVIYPEDVTMFAEDLRCMLEQWRLIQRRRAIHQTRKDLG